MQQGPKLPGRRQADLKWCYRQRRHPGSGRLADAVLVETAESDVGALAGSLPLACSALQPTLRSGAEPGMNHAGREFSHGLCAG